MNDEIKKTPFEIINEQIDVMNESIGLDKVEEVDVPTYKPSENEDQIRDDESEADIFPEPIQYGEGEQGGSDEWRD